MGHLKTYLNIHHDEYAALKDQQDVQDRIIYSCLLSIKCCLEMLSSENKKNFLEAFEKEVLDKPLKIEKSN